MNQDVIPQQPYFLRALYEWCVDSGYTPYISVRVDAGAKVPNAYVKDGQIVLNIGPAAVRNLSMDNVWVSFSARFGGVSQIIEVPVANVLAIYAKETGEGMAFQPSQAGASPTEAADDALDPEAPTPPERPKGRPSLRVVK
ncbi:MAG: ClpXP protease specificity-enhancing factor [Pseudomonadota bacterium]